MLIRVFSSLANSGSVSVQYWLSYFILESTVGRVQLIRDQVLIETQEGKQLKLTNGVLYKKLKRGRPKFTIPLLIEICRLYDPSIEVDRILTIFLNSLIGTDFRLIPFHVAAGKVMTSVPKKSVPKNELKGCKVVTQEKNETVLELNSSKRLQALLIDLVRRQAL